MAWQPPDYDVYEFGPFRLGLAELLCSGNLIPLEKRHIAVLRILVRNSQRLVTYDQLLKEAWGRIVEANNVSGCVFVLRKALKKADPSQDYIETVHGIGYRFAVSVCKLSDERAAEPGITIDSSLLKCLNASRMRCKKQDVPFRTPNVMLTLLDMTSGFTEKVFNNAKNGLGGELRNKLSLFAAETQPYIDRKTGSRHKDTDWFEFEWMQRAAAEARSDGSPVIMEKHLLLGVLQSTSSRMVKWLRANMSERDFGTLIALVRADTGTPINEDFVL